MFFTKHDWSIEEILSYIPQPHDREQQVEENNQLKPDIAKDNKKLKIEKKKWKMTTMNRTFSN